MTNEAQLGRHGRVWWIALGAAMWGLDGVFIVALLHYFSSVQIVLLEHALLSLFAVPVLIWKRRELAGLNRGDWIAVIFIAWGGSAIASVLFTAGFRYGNADVVLIMQKLQPLIAVLLATWLLKERLRKGYWALFGLAMIGAYLLTFGFHPMTSHGKAYVFSALCALGAATLWGGSTVMGRRLVGKASFTTVAALRFAIALPLLFGLAMMQNFSWTIMGHALLIWRVWANLLYQTLIPSLVSLLLYYWGLRDVPASSATIAELAFPATGLLINWWVLNQMIDFGQWIGFALVWMAVVILSRRSPDEASGIGLLAIDK